MLHQNLEHSEGIADAGNRMLLTNILRAAKRYPAYYSTITGYTGKQRFAAETSIKTPFGPDLISRIYEATTKLTANNGLGSVTLDNIGQKKAIKHLHKPLDSYDVQQLIYQEGWPKELVQTILTHSVIIDREFLEALYSHAETACMTPADRFVKHACAIKVEIEKKCRSIRTTLVNAFFYNLGDDECEFLRFRALQSLNFIAGAEIYFRVVEGGNRKDKDGDAHRQERKKLIKKEEDTDEQERTTATKEEPTRELLTGTFRFPKAPSLQKKYDELALRRDLYSPHPYVIFVRSPAMIIRYVGEIVAAQLFLERPFVPEIDIFERDGIRRMAIFLLKRGGPKDASEKFFVSYEGETYTVPKREYGPKASHSSYELLSYIRTRLDLAAAESDLARPTAVLFQ